MSIRENEIDDYRPLIVKIVGHDAPMRWLRAGWIDFKKHPVSGLFYGFIFALAGWVMITILILTQMTSMILPALAGSILVGPLLAVGLYRESQKDIAAAKGLDPVKYKKLNSTQVALTGAILMTVILIWIRAATIIYALFFGLQPFPGFTETINLLLFTNNGLAMLAVGSLIGGFFAAFVYAISAFSLPMLVDQDVDCFTAMGSSFVAVNRNFGVMVHWGIIIMILAALGFVTLLLGMIIIFPVLGHASWHCYDEIFNSPAAQTGQA